MECYRLEYFYENSEEDSRVGRCHFSACHRKIIFTDVTVMVISKRLYHRPGFNCVVKQLRFWRFKVDCEFKDCNLRVLRIGHTCIIYKLRSLNCELREKSQFTIFKLRN